MGKILAIDYGLSRVGTALSDCGKIMAFPFRVIRYIDDEHLCSDIIEIVEAEDVELIVVGFPLHLSSDCSPMGERISGFAENLKIRCGIPIEFIDERLTSRRAASIMHEAQLSPSKNRDKLNCIAASIILESFLEKNH